ncbi:ATP-binding protein [Nocardioides sp. AX2bis]|uniref:ATP-binding protein n=1 Tax=Nocardioides sp. AX2bis TaxID=2653157 RepID=UPI0012EF502A|nr:ATP-binding protein [Nocardioides sp. AX2bis]VXB67965.1 putative Histidine kinase [Nocardioides sp. AX2bis]
MERSRAPVDRWREALALAVLALFSLGLALVGRVSLVGATDHALVWPLSGFVVLWLLHRGPRAGVVDALAVAVASAVALAWTGVSATESAIGGVLVLVQPLVTVALLRRFAPGLARPRGQRVSLGSLAVLGRLALSLVGGVLATVATLLLVSVVGDTGLSWSVGLLWVLRDLAGAFVAISVGLVIAQYRTGGAARGPAGRLHRGSRVEMVGVLGLSSAIFAATFVYEGLPLSFPLLIATGWLALRFDMLVTTAHTAVFGGAITAATLLGHGPFAAVGTPVEAASFVQGFVLLMGASGLVVSAERAQVHALNAELVRAAAANRDQADLLQEMIDAMAEGVMVVDDTGEVLASNPALDRLLATGEGRHTERLQGLMGHRLDGTRMAEDERPSRRALAGERVVREQVLYRADGLPDRVLAATALPLPDHTEAERRRAMILIEDVTADHDRRADLVTFAQMVAHDLRNPLSSILGWTGLVGKRFEETQEISATELGGYLRRTGEAARRMDDLIEHLLDRATRDVEPQDAEVDLDDVLRQVVRERGIGDLVEVAGMPVLRADPGMLHQLVDNLLANAVKFARPGVVHSICCTSRMADGGVVVSIADNGRGVPAGQHEQIFAEGHRAHASLVDGTGLGLAVCRRIVGRHGGTIRAVDDLDGPGAVFEIVVPMERVVSLPQRVPQRVLPAAWRIEERVGPGAAPQR